VGKGILPRTVKNKLGLTREALVGAGVCAQQPGAGKLVRVEEGGKPHRRGEKTTSHVSCKQTCLLAEAAAHAQHAGEGKLVKAVVGGKLHRRRGKTHFPREL
jgi:hypothetical protein